jgi:glycogen(starch) synthase
MKKKILSITPFFPPEVGGISNHVFNVNNNLTKLGFDVTIIAPKHLRDGISDSHDTSNQLVRLNSIYLPGWPYPTLRSFSFPVDFGSEIDSIIKNGKFDMVHVHGHHYPTSWMGLGAAHKYGIPSVLTMHGMYALNPNQLGGKSLIEDLFNKLVFKRVLSKTSSVIGLTNDITNYAKKFGKKSTNYFTIPNGVSVSSYKDNLKRKTEFRQKYHIGKEKTVILFCGRFEKVKGVLEFAQAAKNLVKNEKIEIVIVGGGKLEPEVRSIVSNIDKIHLIKWQPADTIHELYIASDIYVIPSRFEALPLTIIEAMNAGLHIVYTPVGGIAEVLKQYSMKTILEKITPDDIQKVLGNLVSNFAVSDTTDSLAYAQQFDWQKIAQETSQVFSQTDSN